MGVSNEDCQLKKEEDTGSCQKARTTVDFVNASGLGVIHKQKQHDPTAIQAYHNE